MTPKINANKFCCVLSIIVFLIVVNPNAHGYTTNSISLFANSNRFQRKLSSTSSSLPMSEQQQQQQQQQQQDMDTNNNTTSPPPQLMVSLATHLGNQNEPFRLVLASQSPRRREILDMMGLNGKYTAQPSPLEEKTLQQELKAKSTPPIEYTKRLAEEKAYALAITQVESITKTTFYLGSDTIVDLEGTILEKPDNEQQATHMLHSLQGNDHFVHTGVAIYQIDPGYKNSPPILVSSFTDTAKVTFAKLLDKDIEAYVKSGEPMDKAGSYGIQGIGGQFVSQLSGDYFTVMGLPMHKVSIALGAAIQNSMN